jgi:large subunit ribosomal protein L13e
MAGTSHNEKNEGKIAKKIRGVLPIESGVGVKFGVSDVKKGEMGEGTADAYRTLRNARSEARYAGAREKRAKAKEEAEEAKKK